MLQTLSVVAGMDRDWAALRAPHGLSEGRFIVLVLLHSSNYGLAPNTLAERAGVTRGTVTGLLDGLAREELIERHPNADDRRALRVQLTQKGKRVAEAAFEQHGRWAARVFGNLSASEREQLAALREKAAGSLGGMAA